MNTIISTQYRLTPLSGKRHYRNKLLRSKEFPLALKFLKLRAVADKDLMDAYTAWKNVYRQFLRQGMRKGSHHPPPSKKTKAPDACAE